MVGTILTQSGGQSDKHITQVVINQSYPLNYTAVTYKPRHFSPSLILNTPHAKILEAAALERECRFPAAAAEVTPTPVPTHPPTLQKGRWRVEEERLKHAEGEEGHEGRGRG